MLDFIFRTIRDEYKVSVELWMGILSNTVSAVAEYVQWPFTNQDQGSFVADSVEENRGEEPEAAERTKRSSRQISSNNIVVEPFGDSHYSSSMLNAIKTFFFNFCECSPIKFERAVTILQTFSLG